MSHNYYYLVSGLPDITLEDNKGLPPYVEYVEGLMEQVAPEDRELIESLRLPFDNHNLLSVLQKRDGAHDPRGNFSRERLEKFIRFPDDAPGYMQAFIEAQKEERQLFSEVNSADQLSWLFYDAMMQHDNEFLRGYYTFDCNLRNVLAALNYRAVGTPAEEPSSLSSLLVCRTDVTEQLLRSNAPDFGVASSFPWIEQVLSFDSEDLVEFERSLDGLRWRVLDELTLFSQFQIETILAFVIRLALAQRWARLDTDTGRERFEEIVNTLVAGFSFTEDFQ